MSMMVSFVLSFFPRDVLDEILNLIGSVSEGFPSYSYKRAKRTNLELHWKLFKKIRNKVTKMIRESKESHHDKIADKLKSNTLSAKDWWKTLKTFILPSVKTSIPPLEVNNEIIIDESDKANILNNFFQSQTFLNEQNAVLPDLPVFASLNSQLNTILCSRL